MFPCSVEVHKLFVMEDSNFYIRLPINLLIDGIYLIFQLVRHNGC